MDQHSDDIVRHYCQGSLSAKLLDALCRSGVNPDELARKDIAQFEEFHIGGRKTTRQLAELGNLQPGMKLLDIGCGIGGPARTLTEEYGCLVTGLDITPDYVNTAIMLSERVGLGRICFIHGSALDIPCDENLFDIVWMQHLSMNIEDKPKLLHDIRRVLKPNGRLLMHEVMAGNGEPITYPVFWADRPELNHLVTIEQFQTTLTKAGFTIESWNETTDQAIGYFEQSIARQEAGRPLPLGITLLMGEDAPLKGRNMLLNLTQGRIRVVQADLST